MVTFVTSLAARMAAFLPVSVAAKCTNAYPLLAPVVCSKAQLLAFMLRRLSPCRYLVHYRIFNINIRDFAKCRKYFLKMCVVDQDALHDVIILVSKQFILKRPYT